MDDAMRDPDNKPERAELEDEEGTDEDMADIPSASDTEYWNGQMSGTEAN